MPSTTGRLTSYDLRVLITQTITDQTPGAEVSIGRVRPFGFGGFTADLTVRLAGVSTPVTAHYTDRSGSTPAELAFAVAS